MSDRHTADTITDDALDQLYVELGQLYKENAAAVTALADMARERNEQMDRADRAEAALDRVRALAERWRYTSDRKEGPLRELRQALDQQPAPAPAATQATNEACCGKPSGAVCVHDVSVPKQQPREHCGDLTPAWAAGPRTECILRPGHQGSHADDVGARWWHEPTGEQP